MPVTTWTFATSYDGWTFEDISADVTINPCPGCSATRSHVAGAIRDTLVVDNLAFVTAMGEHTSSININASITNGDTIEVDVSATSDAIVDNVRVTGIYTDETSETNNMVTAIAGTLTLTLTQAKLLDRIEIQHSRATGGAPAGSTHTRDIEEVRLTTANPISATAGILRTPQEVIAEQGAGAAGGAGGGASNFAAIGADGLYIYIAAFNSLGYPTIIKILAALTADGSVVFEPGDGGRIGVGTGKFDATIVWTAGEFDGTNTVELSDDAGATFTVKDDGTFGAVRTFEIGPDSDNRVILFDGDNGDIIESLDGGETWTTINAAVTPLINSISRFDVNPEEIIAGNQGAANDSINYSPNSGHDLEDFQTGVYPNANATKVIAN